VAVTDGENQRASFELVLIEYLGLAPEEELDHFHTPEAAGDD